MFEKLNCKIVSVICQLTVLLGTKLFQQKGSSRGHKSLPNHPRLVVFKGLQLIISLPIFGCFMVLLINIVSSLLCCGVGIVPCLFNLLYYVVW